MSSFQLGVIGALFLSVASSVSIVICNKALMSKLGFPFGNYSIDPSFLHSIPSIRYIMVLLGVSVKCFTYIRTKPFFPYTI